MMLQKGDAFIWIWISDEAMRNEYKYKIVRSTGLFHSKIRIKQIKPS